MAELTASVRFCPECEKQLSDSDKTCPACETLLFTEGSPAWRASLVGYFCGGLAGGAALVIVMTIESLLDFHERVLEMVAFGVVAVSAWRIKKGQLLMDRDLSVRKEMSVEESKVSSTETTIEVSGAFETNKSRIETESTCRDNTSQRYCITDYPNELKLNEIATEDQLKDYHEKIREKAMSCCGLCDKQILSNSDDFSLLFEKHVSKLFADKSYLESFKSKGKLNDGIATICDNCMGKGYVSHDQNRITFPASIKLDKEKILFCKELALGKGKDEGKKYFKGRKIEPENWINDKNTGQTLETSKSKEKSIGPCKECGCSDFNYDSYWKEYACNNCGWITN